MMPVGLTSRTTIKMANTTPSFQTESPIAETSASSRPMAMPPIIAPGIEPIPPSTAATKAFRPSMDPMVGDACG